MLPCPAFRLAVLVSRALLLLALAAPCAHAATLNIPTAQYPTIQAGINAAVNGDTVLVADGTYIGPGNVDLDFGGRNITVTSVNGPASTVINCQGSASSPHRGFIFHNGETTAATVSGFTIENGYALNADYDGGGGIVIASSYAYPSINPTITRCVFLNNTASNPGGGISGGGLSGFGSATISRCVFLGNQANGTFASGGGAAIANGTTLTNCTFIGNSTTENGGALFIYGSPAVTNCTFTGNLAPYGGGIACNDYSSPLIKNCIAWGDAASVQDNEVSHAGRIGPYPNVSYSDVQGGYTGTGNINADPLFVRAPNLSAMPPDYGDLHLQSGSLCFGAGTSNGAPTVDFDANVRPNPPSIGAYDVYAPDTTTPVTTAALSGTLGSNGYYIGPVTVTLAASDTGSGVANTHYSVDGGATQGYTTTVTVSGDGAHSVIYYSTDYAGNSETPHAVTFSIDRTPPVTTASASGTTVTLSAADAVSGVAGTVYYIDNGLLHTYSSPFTLSSIAGPQSVSFWSTDNAGNLEYLQTVRVNIPYLMPTLASVNPNRAVAGASAQNILINGTGFVNGISVVQWNGSALPTMYLADIYLQAWVPQTLLANAGTAQITVVNPAPGGGVSNAKTFTIAVTSLKVTMGTPMRDARTGILSVPITVQNTGHNAAPNVQATASKLSGYATLSLLPAPVGTLAPGASASVTLTFPKKAGAAGNVKKLAVSGVFDGGTWSKTQTVILP